MLSFIKGSIIYYAEGEGLTVTFIFAVFTIE